MSSESSVNIEMIDDFAVIHLNRPHKLNALDHDARIELTAAIRDLTDGAHSRGLIVTGVGRSFCAGDDLSTILAEIHDEPSAVQFLEEFHDLSRAILDSKVPTVAAVNGLAVGGAFEWCLSFDWRIGCPDTVFLAPENGIGLTISNGASYLFPRLLRLADVTRVVLDSKPCGADLASAMGLLDSVVDRSALVETAVGQLTAWSREGNSTMHHLGFLRPRRDLVEAAMSSENDAWAAAWNAGLVREGVEQFWRARAAGFLTSPLESTVPTAGVPAEELA